MFFVCVCPNGTPRFLAEGDEVRLGGTELGSDIARVGRIIQVYPRIEDGRVLADAEVEGLGRFFVGERVQIWIASGERRAFVVPDAYLLTRYGVDYVKLEQEDGTVLEVPVQRGASAPVPDLSDAVEILSGLRAGDVLVRP